MVSPQVKMSIEFSKYFVFDQLRVIVGGMIEKQIDTNNFHTISELLLCLVSNVNLELQNYHKEKMIIVK